MWPSDRSGGFTLLEILLVMVLIGVSAGLVFVAVGGGAFQSERRRLLEDFTGALRDARTRGLLSGRPVFFVIDGEGRTYGAGRRRPFPAEVQVEGDGVVEAGGGVYGILFYPDGSSSGGRLDLRWAGGKVDRV
ncbi:prepilin-type N-terminal cleavage/methylation domain-containing protein, partial [Dissulfurirhabdus thermomarina]